MEAVQGGEFAAKKASPGGSHEGWQMTAGPV
jgi:hypothetical protein